MKSRGQITIFIIIAIMIVAAIILFFLLRSGVVPGISQKPSANPQAYLESCIEEKIGDAVNLISAQGGYVNPELFKEIDEDKIAYLCYTHNYYVQCVNQEPMLLKHLDKELSNYLSEDIKNCFDDMAGAFEKQGYAVEARYNGFDITLMPSKIKVDIDGELTLTKSGESSVEKEFVVFKRTKFYELAVIAQEIVSQEAKYCNFETNGFMMFYPLYRIDRLRLGDSTNIYTLEQKNTKEDFKFAVKSCVIPGGL